MKKLSLSLALIASLGAATMASAGGASYFDTDSTEAASSTLEIGYIHAAADGVVKVYDYTGNVQGRLLATEAVAAGSNWNVDLDTGLPTSNKVIAVLDVDGQPAATKVIELNTY